MRNKELLMGNTGGGNNLLRLQLVNSVGENSIIMAMTALISAH